MGATLPQNAGGGNRSGDPYHPLRVLFPLSPHPADGFRLVDAYSGVSIMGGIGSGKTSGSGAKLARSYLRAGFGGLVLCAKVDERETWERYAEAEGRSDDLMIFDASGRYAFNFLNYEMKRPGRGGGYTENLVRLFVNIIEAIERGQGGGGGQDPYWMRAAQQVLRNAVDLCSLTVGEVTLPKLVDVILSAPQALEQVHDATWQAGSLCNKLVDQAADKLDTPAMQAPEKEWERLDIEATGAYWMREFPALDPRPRGSIVSIITSMADLFLRRPFRQLFCGATTILPEHSHRGKIIILDLPVKEYADAGRAAQVMFKYMWQQAIERRSISANPRPVFLWIDEAQNFVTPYDMQYQATARSARACTVLLSQNLSNYLAELPEERAKSIIGNLQTQIWHANADPQTNERAAETIGRSWSLMDTENWGGNAGGDGKAGASFGGSQSLQFEYDVPPQLFTLLKKGGEENNNQVQGVVFQSGRMWQHNGKSHLITAFTQGG